MRIGGLATGMDIDELVRKLMTAERIPLDKMQQDRTMLTWKQDGFRDIYKSLKELDDMMLDMKLSKTYRSKTVNSSNSGAVTATAATGATNGTYRINVTQLASSAINRSTAEIESDIDLGNYEGDHTFFTYDSDGKRQEHTFTIKKGEKLEDVLKRISKEDNNIKAFYDSQSKKVIVETTRTGNYGPGNEIEFADNSFFSDVLKLDMNNEKGGTDAKFEYNGLELTSKTNSYKLNEIHLEFNDITGVPGDSGAVLTVSDDSDTTFDAIMKFIDKYNEVIDKINGSQQEKKYRDFKPLTEEQKEEMTEEQIKKWEEKAKSGILRGESLLTNGMYSMRQSWYAKVETGGEYTSLTQIGLTTSANYLDGGKIVLKNGDETALREAIRKDPESVMKLFSNDVEGAGRGLINRLEDNVESMMKKIEKRAGTSISTQENTIGKRMKDLDKRISNFEKRLVSIETRYWNQFTAMEKAIQRMNQQSMQLMSQFGGMG